MKYLNFNIMDRIRPNNHKPEGLICLYPFYFMQLFYEKGFVCCPIWTRLPIGDIRKQTMGEMWNSDSARKIRKKMYAGDWKSICNSSCPHITGYLHKNVTIPYDDLEKYEFLSPELIKEIREQKDHLDSPPTGFKIDNSNQCNINCIMCTKDERTDDEKLVAKTSADLRPFLATARTITLCGSGDPFAIRHIRELMYDDYGSNPHLHFNLITNGLLLPRFWERIKHNRFKSLTISVDAATRESYEYIRSGAKWDELLKTLAFVKENNVFESVGLSMTVMRSNYREIDRFIRLAGDYGFNAGFQQIYGDHGNENIFKLNERAALLEIADVIRSNMAAGVTHVHWGNLVGLLDRER